MADIIHIAGHKLSQDERQEYEEYEISMLDDIVPEEWLEKARVSFQKHGKQILIVATLGTTVLLILLGSSLIVNAVILGTITTLGTVMLYYRLPSTLKNLINRFSVFFDFLVGIATYYFLGQTATAVLASGIVGILTSVFLMLVDDSPRTKRIMADLEPVP